MNRISETELVLPALYVLNRYGSVDTSFLIKKLRTLLRPTGEDIVILSGRSDDKFSQKVRNLKSHETLKRRGLAEETTRSGKTYFTITNEGKELYFNNQDNIMALTRFSFASTKNVYSEMVDNKNIIVLNEDLTEEVTEGELNIVRAKIRKRSIKFRRAAIEFYSHDGTIDCNACYFNFENKYGEFGKDYIEIHHKIPLHMQEKKKFKIEDALEKVVPLCANCHRMVHRKKEVISVESLKSHIKEA